MKHYLENIIENISFDDLGNWKLPNLDKFSDKKTLFEYQKNAIKNITKVLKIYFEGENFKRNLFLKYVSYGLDEKSFSVQKFEKRNDRLNNKINKRFSFFKEYFKISGEYEDEYISGENFINRAAFWMATGSGKSLVLIKTIELLDYLQSQKLIPQKEIMLLLPREDLIEQFKNEVADFNKMRSRKIELVNLKDYDSDKNSFDFGNNIKVYYYRSDLLRNERKDNILDFKTYDNNGDWYIFLDEAHRGEKENSLMQDYVSVLSRNGFLFNFSATFTDDIDYKTTCYNFNLEKFIKAGYGKNLYLSNSYFNFARNNDELSELEKIRQVLKSLIVFALIKKSKKQGLYHNPLLITLVNSVNTEDSDLILFFKKIEEIAAGKFDEKLFSEIKKELIKEFQEHKKYFFGNEELKFNLNILEKLEIKDLFKQVFNASDVGKIEILEGEKGKELVLKLQTSTKPFALIKIGDSKKFQREKLGNNYEYIETYTNKKYFQDINKNKDINILIGSRSFYEGWDSNRPNVINMINIGKGTAKKFVLQAIGRGIRIEPFQGHRKRLLNGDKNKNILLETLFVFATDKKSVKAIIENVEAQKNNDEVEISLFENDEKLFDLLIPVYKDERSREKIAYFNISKESLKKFKKYFLNFDERTLILKYGLSKEKVDFLIQKINSNDFFQIKSENDYSDMNFLLRKIIHHLDIKDKYVASVKELDDEIIHFKHIKLKNLTDEEIKIFKERIKKVKNFKDIDKKQLALDFSEGKINEDEFIRMMNVKSKEEFKDLKIKKISQHYYLPLIYSENEKQEYIKHIISVESEVRFIKNLEKFIKENKIENEWMFSKIDESLDRFHIPYFYGKENIYRKFFPDFIFWIKNGDKYKIVFVDPKGTNNSEYQNKVDEFEKLFFNEEEAKIFKYKKFEISFDLKLITKDKNAVGKKYEKYWLGDEDFSFLNIYGV